jgi:hypothetical protein
MSVTWFFHATFSHTILLLWRLQVIRWNLLQTAIFVQRTGVSPDSTSRILPSNQRTRPHQQPVRRGLSLGRRVLGLSAIILIGVSGMFQFLLLLGALQRVPGIEVGRMINWRRVGSRSHKLIPACKLDGSRSVWTLFKCQCLFYSFQRFILTGIDHDHTGRYDTIG